MPTDVQRFLEEYTDAYLTFYPASAAALGLHQYDGQVGDYSPAAIAGRVRGLEEFRGRLAALNRNRLTPQEDLDLALVARSLESEVFEWTELRDHERSPLAFNYLLDVSQYIKRNYAPLPERVVALASHLEGVAGLLADVRTHLGPRPLPRPIVETALDVYRGYLTFYDETLPPALDGLNDRLVYERFLRARDSAQEAVREFVTWLETEAAPRAVEPFAIGENLYRRMLATGELVDVALDRLLAAAEEELRRNRETLARATAEIDRSAPAAEVIRRLAREHPSEQMLLPETRRMLEDLRTFLVERGLVTIPTEIRPIVEETPPFARWAFAMMDTAGPFEEVASESYYYVTPPEAAWTAEQKEEWLSQFSYPNLKITSVHEAYPGHYVHFLHVRRAPSRPSRIFTSYAFVEGWAHYTEELVIEQDLDPSPQFRIAQALEALVRNVRYLAAIRMHAGELTLDQATQMFRQHAFMEELPARKEAVRGTFDPGYLNYLLGKLMLRKLRADYQREQGADFSLRRFHDTLLALGAPPVPLARRALLAARNGTVL